MRELQVCLLGAFQVSWNFKPIGQGAWQNPWAAKLLKLILIRRPDPVPIEEAANLLGCRPFELLAAIERLCTVLQPAVSVLVDEAARIQFVPTASCWIDVDAFLSHYETGVARASRGEMLSAILAFQEADALYQGELLEEMQEPWLEAERRRYAALYLDTLERLADGHAVLARYHDAVGFCHKALAHDPLRESAYQRMMVYYYYLGDPVSAEEAYTACRETLSNSRRGVSAETDQLREHLATRGQAAPLGQAAAASQSELKPDRK
jgi:DNA-binding SARP family transcriptional activator